VCLEITNRDVYRPVSAGAGLLRALALESPDRFELRGTNLARLAGTRGIESVVRGRESIEAEVASWDAGIRDFRRRSARYHLYP
jgi:uncharacterized protein YbbC (DUF1343 family)